MALPGMGWLTDLLGWDEEEPTAPPVDIEALRAQNAAQRWRQAVAPTATAGPQPRTDPLQSALDQWRAGSGQQAPARPMQGPLRPGEQRPMVPSVGPSIAPPTAPVDQPAANPWLAAVDAWRQGPPQQPAYNPLSSANTGQPKPAAPTDISSLLTYDVNPTLPQIGTGYDRPDTGAASFTAQQTQAPTVGSNLRPNFGPQPYKPEDWLSRQIGEWAKPAKEITDTAGGFLNDYARNVGEIGPLDATRELFKGTAGYDKAMADYQLRQQEDKTPGWNGLFDNPILDNSVVDNLMTGMDSVFTIPGKAIETTQIPGTGALLGGPNVSAGQLASATGEMLNKTLNPFNPNQVDLSYLDLAKDLVNGGENVARSLFWDNLRQSQAVRTAFDALPEDMRTQANAAMVKLIAGPEETKSAIDAVLNQDSMVAELEQKAQQAQAQGDAQAAAQFGAQANELKNKSKSELIDEHGNAWAEFLGGVIFDPTNLIGGGGQEAIQAAKSSALMNLTPEAALKALDGVLDNATKAATGGNVGSWWNAVNPFARTADTQAAMATDTLWRAATNLMADVTNKEQAKAIVDMWTGDPRQLVEGVVLPGSTEITKWGPGVVANQELLKQYPVLVKAREAMLNMRSIAGDPATFSPTEFFAELNDVLYKSSRELFGLKTLDELPAGAVNFRTVKTANGTSVIEYVDKQGKVLKQSAEMLPYDAELQSKQLKQAIKSAGPGGQSPLAATWGVQKAILSDMYLGMSPGYWIKNATSAAATLLTDNTMTLLPTNQILNEMMSKFGGVLPTTRSAEAGANALGQAAGEALGGMHWSEKLFGKENVYSKMMNKLYSIPFGATDIAGRVPFGEQNFALRATYVPFKRYLTSQWGDAARGFEQTLTTLGIDPNLAKSLANTVADVGVNGNKQQLQQVMKKLTTAQVVPFSLKELGVPDELVSAEGWAKLNTVLSETLPDQVAEAAAKVSEIFGQEFKQAGQLLNSAPPQPGRYVWTEFESVQDGADVVDSMVDAAKRAGLPADQMRQEAQQLMQGIAQTEKALWDTLRGDLAGATDPASLNVAMDLMAKWYDWRQTARAQVDALSKQAISTNTADAWAKKFEGTRQIYGGFNDFFQKATDEARQNLIKLEQGGQVDGGYDWWNVIKRYASYDEAEVMTARTAGLGVGSPQGQGDVFTKALDANRKYVDKSVVELFSAFRRYPSQTALDLMSDGIRKMEELGAKAAGFLAEKRTEMLPKNADAYYKLRNQVWAEFFDNAVVHNNVVKRLVVASGVADMAKGALKWSDEFSGGEFQLVGKLSDGFWQARNTATGELVRFADPVALQQAKNARQVVVSSLPTVPLTTVQDFYRVIGENTNIVDKLISELDAEAATRLAAQAPTAPVVEQAAEAIPGALPNALPAQVAAPVPQPAVTLPTPPQATINYIRKKTAPYLQEASQKLGLPPEQVVQQARQNFVEAVQNAPVEMQIWPQNLDKVLDSGAYKSAFDIQDMPGRILQDYMTLNEAQGIPLTATAAERPVYAMLANDPTAVAQAGEYGTIRIRLKDDVKQRLTYAPGDTGYWWKEQNFTLLPTADPNNVDETFFGPLLEDWANKQNIKDFYGESNSPYIEVQIFGGVRPEDIAAVYVDEAVDGGGPSAKALQWFQERGIPVNQWNSETDAGLLESLQGGGKGLEDMFKPTPTETDFGVGFGQLFGKLKKPAEMGPAPRPTALPYQPTPQHIEQVKASVQRAVDRSAQKNKITPQQVEQYVQQALDQLAQSDVVISAPKNVIDNILDDGRFRTQFETGTSSATVNKAMRTEAEKLGLGIPENLPADQRPVYGYLNFSKETRNITQRGYGEVSFVLSDSVRPRTTIGVGDTMDNFRNANMVGAPIDAPNILAADHEISNLVDYARTGDTADFVYSGMGYVEAHVQGGVTLNDIKAVLDEKGVLTPEQVQRFADQGIQVLQGDAAKVYGKLPERAAGGLVQTPGTTDFGAGIGQAFGKIIDALAGGRSNNPYTVAPTASGWNPWGIAEAAKQTDLYKLVSGINGNLGDLLGKKAPEVGEMAQHTIRTLTDAERKIIQRLPEILAGKQNTMTPAQQMRVLDALNEMMPQYDNILAGAVRTGEQMANYAMLNYSDKRNLDVWAASLMPYHYFWSRSAKNWMQRAVQKPGIVNMWYESQRAIDQENQQNNIPQHLQGTIQNPLAQFGVGPDRLANPLDFMLPFSMYLGSDFVNPDDARSDMERWMMTIKKYTPAMYPIADYATKALLDQTAPLPGGKRRTDEFQLGDVLPLYKMAGYGYQAMTGDMSMSQGPLGYGDEYDYGRAGKQVALAGLRGDINPNDAMWAPDVGYQQQTGANALPEQQGQGVGAWQQGAQAAGWERLMNRAGAFLTGVPGYNLSPEEQQMRDMKAQRVQLGYNEVTNPYGSKEAVNAYTNMQPEQFDATFNYSALYPSSDTTKRLRPGEKAVQTEYYNQHGVIMNDMSQAVAKFLIANPNATSKDLYEIKDPFWKQVEELKAKYPSLPTKEVKHLNTKYMNPVEHAAGFVQSILSHKPAGQPTYPGKDATPEQKKEYFLAKAKWDTARLDYYDRQFTQLLNQDDTYPDPWKEAARKMVKDMYSSELLRGYENRYAGDVEKAWSDRQSFVEEVEDAQRTYNAKNVEERVGAQGNDILSQYYALPKGEERKAFKQENPLVNQAILASYHPAEYDEFVKRFGPDAFAMVSGGPKHPGDGATEAQLQQYYAAADAYAQQYPNAEAAKLWLNGRRYGAAEGEDSYGVAYDEAVKIFGPNIFDILNSVPQGKDAYVAWLKANPEEYMLYTGYREWKNEYKEEDKATVGQQTTPEEEAIIPNANAGQGYTGPRPVGSERYPLGQFDPYATTPEQQIPNAWTARNWDELLQQPADNAWTQRANELNAALLGDKPIPSQMASPTATGPQIGPRPQGSGPIIPDWAGNDKPTTGGDMKTAREYAGMNDKWVKGEMTRQEWAARRGNVQGYFGAGGAKMFDEYYNLPKGPQREEYLKKNVVMRAINLYAYNSKELAPALKMIGDDALGLWALTPAYADTPEAKAARNAYYDKNPKAFEFGAWLNGRPANYDESKEGSTDFKYNFGKDYDEAKKLFGDDIWSVVGQFKRGWNSTQKRLWYEKNPQYNAWADWWYGREKKERSTGGGGGFAGFGGYQKQERKTQVRIQDVYGQGMSGGLAEPARVAGYQNPQIDLDWMRAGQELKPGRQVREWTPDWIRGIKKSG